MLIKNETINLLKQDLLLIFISLTLNLSGRDPGIHLSNPITKSSYSGYQIPVLRLPNPTTPVTKSYMFLQKHSDLVAEVQGFGGCLH